MNTRDTDDDSALDGRGAKLLLPGGALMIYTGAADGVVVLPDRAVTHNDPRGSVRIEYQDPQGRVFAAFRIPGVSVLLSALEPFALQGGG